MTPTIYFAHLKNERTFSQEMRSQLAQAGLELLNYYETLGILKVKVGSEDALKFLKELEFLDAIEPENSNFGI